MAALHCHRGEWHPLSPCQPGESIALFCVAPPLTPLTSSSWLRILGLSFSSCSCHHLVTSHYHHLLRVPIISWHHCFCFLSFCLPDVCCSYSLYPLHSNAPRQDLMALLTHYYLFLILMPQQAYATDTPIPDFLPVSVVLMPVQACLSRTVWSHAGVCWTHSYCSPSTDGEIFTNVMAPFLNSHV